jgi:hypothetical protein
MAPIISRLASVDGSATSVGSVGSLRRAYLARTSSSGGSTAYQILNSLRAEGGGYLSRTFSSGNRTTWTWSGWVKRNSLGSGHNIFVGTQGGTSNTTHSAFYFHPNNQIYFGGWNSVYFNTTAVFRDTNAWYHIVLAVDTNQSTATDRLKLYINNTLQSYSQGAGFPSTGSDLGVNQSGVHNIGGNDPQSGNAEHSYGDIYFIDGQQLTPSSFAQEDPTTGVWVPKQTYSGTYGTTGFHLTFPSSGSVGQDSSGLGNNWTANGGVTLDSSFESDYLFDAPSSYNPTSGTTASGNYCTFSSVSKYGSGTVSEGGTAISMGSGGYGFNGSIAVKSGKWYWEGIGTNTRNGYVGGRIGFGEPDNWQSGESVTNRFLVFWHPSDGIALRLNGSTVSTASATYVDGDILAWALDADSNIVYAYKNNSLQATVDFSSTVSPGTRWLCPTDGNGSSGTPSWQYRFGSNGFNYTPRTGHKALCTANLPDPTIAKPVNYFDVLKWSGAGNTNDRSLSIGFQADLIWSKTTSGTAYHHNLWDSLRGFGTNNAINMDQNYSQGTASSGRIKSVSSSSITWEAAGTSAEWYNGSGNTYCAWVWKAGGAPTATNTGGQNPTSGSVMINGSASTAALPSANIYPKKMSVNTDTGFSIVLNDKTTTSVQTIPHALGRTPSFIMSKLTNGTSDWYIAFNCLDGSWDYMVGNSTAGKNDQSISGPNTTVFTAPALGGGSEEWVHYVWAEIPGFSRFGHYSANTTDGPFFFCGFRPAMVIIRSTTTARDWLLYDNERGPYNPSGVAQSFTASTEYGGYDAVDFLSNGIKINGTGSPNFNGSGESYIVAAWAEHPLKYSNAK